MQCQHTTCLGLYVLSGGRTVQFWSNRYRYVFEIVKGCDLLDKGYTVDPSIYSEAALPGVVVHIKNTAYGPWRA